MITAAEKLIKHPKLEKPTVLMLVDRNELETQLFQNLTAYGFGSVTVALRKSHLRELLASGQRGLIVSMIHKFEGMPKEINTSRNVFVLIDEAHLIPRQSNTMYRRFLDGLKRLNPLLKVIGVRWKPSVPASSVTTW